MSEDRKDEFHGAGGLNPNIAPHHVKRQIHVLIDEERRVESVNLVRKTLQEYPNDIGLYINAATSLTRLGEIAEDDGNAEASQLYYNQAIDYAMVGLQLNPNDIRLLTTVGSVMRRVDEFENAEEFYLRAVRADPYDKRTWTAMGDMYARWGENEEAHGENTYEGLMQDAVNCYAQALELDPQDQKTHNKMERIQAKGFIAAEEGYDHGDEALYMIQNADISHPRDLPVISAAPSAAPTAPFRLGAPTRRP